MIGKQVAHYKITAKIGEGMGEVYRATDTKLNRDAALKRVLQQQRLSESKSMEE